MRTSVSSPAVAVLIFLHLAHNAEAEQVLALSTISKRDVMDVCHYCQLLRDHQHMHPAAQCRALSCYAIIRGSILILQSIFDELVFRHDG